MVLSPVIVTADASCFLAFTLTITLEVHQFETFCREAYLNVVSNFQNCDLHSVETKVVMLVKKHIQIRSTSNELNLLMQNAIIWFVISGSFLGVCISASCLLGEIPFFLKFGVFYSYLSIVMTFLHGGQLLENQNDKFNNIVSNCVWYTWDINSRKIFFTILLNMERSISFYFTQGIVVNHVLLMKVLKGIFTTITVVLQISA
ncbi:uncharacterized protein LOC109605657 [Aethina tumida]|uniref:uncharacterized protein LOC109605657 n=1 Tax=Aethina tumida TaxID=116153 RepID=UPI00096B5B04|nr:uncharacterized protein LOC109605657 [Aethina tumida]